MLLMFGAAAAALLERRFVPVSMGLLVALLFVFNPASWRFYGEHVTGHLNYRLLWAVPFPMLLSIATGVVWMSLPRIGRFGGAVLLGWIAAAGVAGIAWGFAHIKVPRSDYGIETRALHSARSSAIHVRWTSLRCRITARIRFF